jgi:hypothetical protein
VGRHALFGATDMHGLGYAATVWNVAELDGWREMSDAALAAALIERFRTMGHRSHRVVAMTRWRAATPSGAPATVPVNALLLLRTASAAHAAALLGWIWLPVLLSGLSRRGRSP